MLLAGEGEDRRGEEDVYERDFKKVEPADAHELVETEARERPAHPDKEHEQRSDLAEEAHDVGKAEQPMRKIAEEWQAAISVAIGDTGDVPSAEEKHDDE